MQESASFWLGLGRSLKKVTQDATGSAWIAEMAHTLVGVVAILSIILLSALILVYLERKVCAWMQMRLGPNRLGPFGIFQTIADILKLMTKEDIQPTLVSPIMWALAPILLFMAAMTTYAVIPFDAGVIFADLNIGIFFFFAVGSQASLPLLMAGWSSNNKYAMIGGMRTVAQMISYEIPMVFSILGVVMIAGSMKMSDIVKAQEGLWFIVTKPVAFVIYTIAATAETNRYRSIWSKPSRSWWPGHSLSIAACAGLTFFWPNMLSWLVRPVLPPPCFWVAGTGRGCRAGSGFF